MAAVENLTKNQRCVETITFIYFVAAKTPIWLHIMIVGYPAKRRQCAPTWISSELVQDCVFCERFLLKRSSLVPLLYSKQLAHSGNGFVSEVQGVICVLREWDVWYCNDDAGQEMILHPVRQCGCIFILSNVTTDILPFHININRVWTRVLTIIPLDKRSSVRPRNVVIDCSSEIYISTPVEGVWGVH